MTDENKRGTMGDHDLMTYPRYGGKWRVDEKKWWKTKKPYQKHKCDN